MRSIGDTQNTITFEECESLCSESSTCFGMHFDSSGSYKCYLYSAVEITTISGDWYWSGERPTSVGPITNTHGNDGSCLRKIDYPEPPLRKKTAFVGF